MISNQNITLLNNRSCPTYVSLSKNVRFLKHDGLPFFLYIYHIFRKLYRKRMHNYMLYQMFFNINNCTIFARKS